MEQEAGRTERTGAGSGGGGAEGKEGWGQICRFRVNVRKVVTCPPPRIQKIWGSSTGVGCFSKCAWVVGGSWNEPHNSSRYTFMNFIHSFIPNDE